MTDRFIWYVDKEGSHQLVQVKPGKTIIHGSTSSYRCPSVIEHDDYVFAIFTQYWEGMFLTEKVLKITKESEVRIKRVDEL